MPPKNNGRSPPPVVLLPGQRSERSKRRAAEREARAAALRAKAPPMPETPAGDGLERAMLTPELAMTLLDHNTLNRPISQAHVDRIAGQIAAGKWKYNGDTIKVSVDQEILDGQHRLWAVIEAKQAVETVIVYGLQRDAFATIDTIRRMRSGGDTIALAGIKKYRNEIAAALGWLLRYQRGCIENYRAPQCRIENSDIEDAFTEHPQIERAVEAAMKLRLIVNPAILGFAYYVLSNWHEDTAEALVSILRDPGAQSLNHPFFRLRNYFLTDRAHKKDPTVSIALIFKAALACRERREIQHLMWRNQGQNPESFPRLAA